MVNLLKERCQGLIHYNKVHYITKVYTEPRFIEYARIAGQSTTVTNALKYRTPCQLVRSLLHCITRTE